MLPHMRWDTPQSQDLFRALTRIKNPKQMGFFLRDLLTAEEITEFSRRWRTAQLLAAQETYETIQKKTGLSSTTIARISKWLTRGTGGYRTAIKTAQHHTHHHTRLSVE
ncbi:MAG: hypothetical protein A3C15_00555 [Candidatus Magasanikbacteria bacterium RIFCSPHIGHO2_02_FULL_50_9b]|uniref:TrpR, YerC/YecD n=1 Tax=Candidatus Magasanikbacteria bacterium RIFCSPHIGHO2_02_FULL_50_9b TaxID=1798682 RepID=A0A1F6M8U9_9BACT|nr:MAG: hypothetical protein A3C15_00555 [Candidatus Magasanikbacteria bacterium RIFCSPHIGHO2_02_FULL_50_9b]